MTNVIQINDKTIDLSNARVDIDDLNSDDQSFDPSAVQVNVTIGGIAMAYQTSPTLDAGGISSKLAINSESGAYEQVLSLLTDNDAINDDDDEDDQVYAAGLAIGEALNVQTVYDDYLSDKGQWERSDGMDANSERFVSNSH